MAGNWRRHCTAMAFLLFISASCCCCCCAFVVTELPGFHGRLPFHLETGYVTVDEINGGELFYYFVESERSPSTDPIILWLTGGPGCSVFCGLAFEIGPVKFIVSQYNGSIPQLELNPYSWTQVASIVFVDSPLGTGFSFAANPKGYDVGDVTSSLQLRKFIIAWFANHPRFQSNSFYVGGDSYAGLIVPYLAQKISEDIDANKGFLINLKGYLVGNPLTGDASFIAYRIPYAHGVGIISDQIYEVTLSSCKGDDYNNPRNELCAKSLERVNRLTDEVDTESILEDKCESNRPMTRRKLSDGVNINLNEPPPEPPLDCVRYKYYLSYFWANDRSTRDALGVKKGTVDEWIRCNFELPYVRDMGNTFKYHLNLTRRGYRALVYSGDHDLVVPFLSTQAWVRSLNYSILDDWRAWHVSSQSAGFTIQYFNNITFATVKGAGHTAPEFRPKQSFYMISRWLTGKPL